MIVIVVIRLGFVMFTMPFTMSIIPESYIPMKVMATSAVIAVRRSTS
jgi:hypothetical protein